tara:strand:- start:1284 stop:1778 length:495 start_codon:yes stop_codon:yes gene_type:complete
MQKIKLFNKNNFFILKTEQIVNSKIEDVWEYFTQIRNLEKIMPKKYKTKVTIGRRSKIYSGKLFNIRMKILPFVYSNITSEIKAVEKNKYFIDSQIFGPYKIWHHEHHFIVNEDESIKIVDVVRYQLRGIPFMKTLHKFFIKKEIIKTFNHRANKINNIFKNHN